MVLTFAILASFSLQRSLAENRPAHSPFSTFTNIIKQMDADKKALSGNSRHKRRENPVTGCPLTAAVAAIGGKWKMIIVYWLAALPKHFAGLKREMSSI